MEQELKDQGKFKDFYQFTFNFAKNPGQKGLGMYRFSALSSCDFQEFWGLRPLSGFNC